MDFVSFSLNEWNDPWTCRQQITSRLARTHKVLFVSPPKQIRDLLRGGTKNSDGPGVHRRMENLFCYFPSPLYFETWRFPRLNNVIKQARLRSIRNTAARLRFGSLASIIWHPRFWDYQRKLGEQLSCYYVYDDFSSYEGLSENARERIQREEDYLLRNSDLVIVAGSALMRLRNRYGNAVMVPNGVDFDLFSRALLPSTIIPDEVANIPPPRIGHIGNLTNKIDFGLLAEIAEKRPKWSILLIGPVNLSHPRSKRDLEMLKSHRNVYFLGGKQVEQLPNYVKGLDVCLMAYRTDTWMLHGYPLKVHEYLSSGKPVVSSDLETMREFTDVLTIATSVEQWIAGIEEGLRPQDDRIIEKRVETARQNTWDKRVETIETAIKEKLREKYGTDEMLESSERLAITRRVST